jgi:hypothetical protein
MFEGAHFCMACGSRMDAGDNGAAVGAPPDVDDTWETGSKGSDGLVPDDELEIEEIDASTAQTTGDSTKRRTMEALRQVRDYLIEVDLEADPKGHALEVCREVLGSLNGSVQSLDKELADACHELSRALDVAKTGATHASLKDLNRVKEKYNKVATLVPELGDFEDQKRHRMELTAKAIVEQVPGLGPLQREKLKAAGFDDIQRLCGASPKTIQSAGLSEELAQRVFERIARYKRRLNSIPPEADRTAERQRLRRLTNLLKQQNHKFETLTNDWSKGSQSARRQVRDERAETMSQVTLLLARLGELGMAEKLAKLPFDKKACELERLLGTLDDAHGQVSLSDG